MISYFSGIISQQSQAWRYDQQLYETTLCSGTFDRIHQGHIQMVEAAIYFSKKYIKVGLSTDDLLIHKPHLELIYKYDVRLQNIVNLIQNKVKEMYDKGLTKYPIREVVVLPIKDRYGDVLEEEYKDTMMIVSQETEFMIVKINQLRAEKKMQPIPYYVVQLVLHPDGTKYSSSEIRDEESRSEHEDQQLLKRII